MSIDSPHSQDLLEDRKGLGSSKLLAGLCAFAITAILFSGYALLRKRHAERSVASVAPVQNTANVSKGPPKIHVLVDDPMLKAGETLIGGTVKNISSEELSDLSVELELRRRKDGSVEQKSVPIEPSTLGPGNEGRYAVKLPAQHYGSVRLIGIRQSDANLLTYTSGQGLRRPLEKTESKTIMVQKPGSRHGEFINTPDNPVRVP
jgi:hypothetical protein